MITNEVKNTYIKQNSSIGELRSEWKHHLKDYEGRKSQKLILNIHYARPDNNLKGLNPLEEEVAKADSNDRLSPNKSYV